MTLPAPESVDTMSVMGCNCRSACTTRDHRSLGECLRASGIRVATLDQDREKRWQRDLDAYWAARKQGVQPAGTRLEDTRQALDLSDDLGFAVDAGRPI